MYSLRRLRDGEGDSGSVSMALWEENGEIQREHNSRPKIGVALQVGSPYARTMQWQDWWQCSIITEILEDKKKYVKFKTGNSIYEWKII